MLKGKVFGAVLNEVDLPIHVASEKVLTHVELKDKGLSGLTGYERRIQSLDGGDELIGTIFGATARIDSGCDTHEAGMERELLSRWRPHRELGYPRRTVGNPLDFAILDARAFLNRFTEQKPIEPRRSARPPAG